MLSANSETETIMKGIKHGACDYLVKPVRLEQLRNIWTHVVKNSKTDPRNSINSGCDAGQQLPSGDGNKGETVGANQTKKYSKKNKKDVDGANDDNENTSTQKKQRIQWSGHLHRAFVQAVHDIGMDSKFSHFMVLSINNMFDSSVKFVSHSKFFCCCKCRGCSKEDTESHECGRPY